MKESLYTARPTLDRCNWPLLRLQSRGTPYKRILTCRTSDVGWTVEVGRYCVSQMGVYFRPHFFSSFHFEITYTAFFGHETEPDESDETNTVEPLGTRLNPPGIQEIQGSVERHRSTFTWPCSTGQWPPRLLQSNEQDACQHAEGIQFQTVFRHSR